MAVGDACLSCSRQQKRDFSSSHFHSSLSHSLSLPLSSRSASFSPDPLDPHPIAAALSLSDSLAVFLSLSPFAATALLHLTPAARLSLSLSCRLFSSFLVADADASPAAAPTLLHHHQQRRRQRLPQQLRHQLHARGMSCIPSTSLSLSLSSLDRVNGCRRRARVCSLITHLLLSFSSRFLPSSSFFSLRLQPLPSLPLSPLFPASRT